MTQKSYSLFSTPVLVIAELIRDLGVREMLKQIVLDEQKRSPSAKRSNRHGWESEQGLGELERSVNHGAQTTHSQHGC